MRLACGKVEKCTFPADEHEHIRTELRIILRKNVRGEGLPREGRASGHRGEFVAGPEERIRGPRRVILRVESSRHMDRLSEEALAACTRPV